MEHPLVDYLERFRNSDSITAEEMLTYLSLHFKLSPDSFEAKKKTRRGRRPRSETTETTPAKENEPTL